MNRGYWVWLIPLGSGNTSVGIVTDESIHPQATYGQSFNQSMEWLRVNEPALHEYLQGREPMDFLTLKNFSYTSAQVFSHHRWSCVGEAGVFLDPFYSVGSDYIAMANTITVELIRRDRAGELTEEAIGTFNKFFLEILFNTWLRYYQGTYNIFGHAHIFTPKHAWTSACVGWTSNLRQGLRSADPRDPCPRRAFPRPQCAPPADVHRLVHEGPTASDPCPRRFDPHAFPAIPSPGPGGPPQTGAGPGGGAQEP
jgi:hypothetical protein